MLVNDKSSEPAGSDARSFGAYGPHSIGYRPDVDGLRAIAVVAVLAYHAFPHVLPGGFVGVDIFFVISGYLITGIIQRQMLEKRFSIGTFYARRILRIFPALIAVLLVTFIIGWFLLSAAEMEALGANIAGAAAFVQNFVLREQIVGYFDRGADRLPLLHLWSLGIEEQYYIAWPITLLLMARLASRNVVIVTALALLSFSACTLIPSWDATLAFYSPLTRAWELLVGSALALWQSKGFIGIHPSAGEFQRHSTIVAIAALSGIASAFWAFNAATSWPGFFTLVPVLAAAVLIAIPNTLVHRRLLSARPVVFIGLISYPLYLWHFPLMAYAKLHYGERMPALVMCALLAVSALLAWLTYRFVERPFRLGKLAVPQKIGILLVGMATAGLIGIVADSTRGLPVRFPLPIRSFMLSGSETSIHWRRSKCLLLLQPASDFAPECAGNGRHPLLLIWGDSYGAALYPGLLHFAADRGYSIAQYTASACPPLVGFTMPERPFCKSINEDVLVRIRQLNPDAVILDATWGHAEETLRQDLPRTASLLRTMNISKIVLMGPPPSWLGAGLSANVLDYYRETRSVLPARTFYRSNDEWTRGRDAMLAALSRELGIQYISVRNIFCNDGGCLTRIGPNDSELTAFDPGHLTVPASIFLASRTLGEILDAAAPPAPHQSSAGIPR
jgi:peptidoglycan/LPS O-acetylase OafA/YrhL